MDPKLFAELTKSVKQAGAIARGERKPARRRALSPSRVLAVREKADLSQAQFARLLNVSVRTLRNWEQAYDKADMWIFNSEQGDPMLLDTVQGLRDLHEQFVAFLASGEEAATFSAETGASLRHTKNSLEVFGYENPIQTPSFDTPRTAGWNCRGDPEISRILRP
jgi:transcriptional regulator with XRE-family HTH domain